MKDVSDVIMCVVDRGLFPHIALCCAEQAKHVYYTGPTKSVMEQIKDGAIGDGFEKITRAKSLWEVKELVDVFVFTDVGFGAEQKELVSQGFPVWGHHGADELESKKGLFLDTLESLGMPVPPHTRLKGFSSLITFLAGAEDKWVKISTYRGDWETFHWRNATLDWYALEGYAFRLGPIKEHMMFYVFDKIETDIEDGIDTWCIDGRWPKQILHAMERKDKSLIGAIQPMSDVQEEIRGVNETFGPKLSEYGYRGAFSTECRMAEDITFFIDPTCRFGSPPSQLQTVLIKNLPSIIWSGANGEVEEPECGDEPFGAQVLITSYREKDEWMAFDMTAGLRPWVKSSFCCQIDGVIQILPNPLENWAGWLVATGDSIESTIATLQERVKLLPEGFDCDLSSLCDLLRELESAKVEGVEISNDPVPEPEIILETNT